MGTLLQLEPRENSTAVVLFKYHVGRNSTEHIPSVRSNAPEERGSQGKDWTHGPLRIARASRREKSPRVDHVY